MPRKTLHLGGLASIFLLGLAVGCSSENDAPPGSATLDGDEVRLELRLEAGERFSYRTRSRTEETLQAPGEPQMRQDSVETTVREYTVRGPSEEGGTLVVAVLRELKIDTTVAGERISLHVPAQPPTERAKEVFGVQLALVGEEILLDLDSSGRVRTPPDLTAVEEKVLGEIPESQRAAVAPAIREALATWGQTLALTWEFPSRTVRVGEKWPYGADRELLMGNLREEGEYHFVGWEDRQGQRCARIDSRARTVSGEGTAPVEGELTGTLWYDPSRGKVREYSMEQTMRLEDPAGRQPTVTSTARANMTLVEK